MNMSINKKTFLISENKYNDLTVKEVLEKYTPLAKSWCHRYSKGIYEYEDMLQEIHIAMINAYYTYKLNNKVSLGCYLNVCIKNALVNFCSVEKYRKHNSNCCSMDIQCNEENNASTIHNFIEDKNSTKMFETINNKLYISKILSKLPEKERKILEYTFLHEETQEYISKKLNMSQAQISRLKNKSLKTLRKYCINNQLYSYNYN